MYNTATSLEIFLGHGPDVLTAPKQDTFGTCFEGGFNNDNDLALKA